mmetsp:Transcript_4903/g.11323  ORF Transcript_4903/g.11323 Transcript_4903/m.11323 type:complete len:203 (-) Transcript_4903:50-658(-)
MRSPALVFASFPASAAVAGGGFGCRPPTAPCCCRDAPHPNDSPRPRSRPVPIPCAAPAPAGPPRSCRTAASRWSFAGGPPPPRGGGRSPATCTIACTGRCRPAAPTRTRATPAAPPPPNGGGVCGCGSWRWWWCGPAPTERAWRRVLRLPGLDWWCCFWFCLHSSSYSSSYCYCYCYCNRCRCCCRCYCYCCYCCYCYFVVR